MKLFHNFLVIFILLLYSSHFVSLMSQQSQSLLLHAAAIYALFTVYGIYQEKISHEYKNIKYSSSLLPMFLHSLGGILASKYSLSYNNQKKSNYNSKLIIKYIILSILTILSSQFWSLSLNYLSYPTLVVSKSCKLLSIALMNFIIYRNKLTKQKYFNLLLTTISVLLFAISDTKKSNFSSNSYKRVILLFFNLALEGFISVLQDRIFKEYRISSLDMMYSFNLVRFILSVILLIFTRSLVSSLKCIFTNVHFFLDLLVSTATNVLGQVFVYSMIEKFGTLTLNTVNVTRKMTSIIISVLLFGHSLSFIQGISIIGVLLSIFLEFNNKREKIKKI